jgi:hypothetical protein
MKQLVTAGRERPKVIARFFLERFVGTYSRMLSEPRIRTPWSDWGRIGVPILEEDMPAEVAVQCEQAPLIDQITFVLSKNLKDTDRLVLQRGCTEARIKIATEFRPGDTLNIEARKDGYESIERLRAIVTVFAARVTSPRFLNEESVPIPAGPVRLSPLPEGFRLFVNGNPVDRDALIHPTDKLTLKVVSTTDRAHVFETEADLPTEPRGSR